MSFTSSINSSVLNYCISDCPIEGQVYQDCHTCPLTCTQLDKICSTQCIPGCGCPESQVIDEQNSKCILLRDCPS